MNQSVRDYLIRAHNKVVGHYHQVLKMRSLAQPERARIERGLASIEAELETVVTGGVSHSMRLVQAREPSHGVAPAFLNFV